MSMVKTDAYHSSRLVPQRSHESAEVLAQKLHLLILNNRPRVELEPLVQIDQERHRKMRHILVETFEINTFGQVGEIVATYARTVAINVKISHKREALPFSNPDWDDTPRNCIGVLFELAYAYRCDYPQNLRDNCQYLLEEGVEINDEPLRCEVNIVKCAHERGDYRIPSFKSTATRLRDEIIVPFVLKHKVDVSNKNKKPSSISNN